MAERLTDKNTVRVCNNSNSEIYLGKGEEVTKYIYKLAQYEDILEKYGIESAGELDKNIEYVNKIIKAYKTGSWKKEKQKLKTDRDTWKRACELACKRICYMLDQEMQYHEHEKFNSEEYLKTEIDYFYQQAKKEEKNDV